MSATRREPPARASVQASNGVLSVSGMLTFATVPDVFKQSAGWITKPNGPLTVDLNGVSRADSAGLALLVEWRRLARRAGRELRFTDIPEQVQSLIHVSGLSQAFGLNDH